MHPFHGGDDQRYAQTTNLGVVDLITIRKAKGGDLEVINKLTDEMHRYLACLYGLKLTLGELEEEHFDEEELENTWVAEVADKGVVGYMSFSRGVNEWARAHNRADGFIRR
jgi:arylsulfatase A-like enzyme